MEDSQTGSVFRGLQSNHDTEQDSGEQAAKMQTFWLVFAFTLVLFITKRIVEFRNAEKAIQ